MSELVENQQATLTPLLELNASDTMRMLEGINRCTERLKRLIELQAPMVLVKKETSMIQYRALGVLSGYEASALLNFVYSVDEEPKKGSE